MHSNPKNVWLNNMFFAGTYKQKLKNSICHVFDVQLLPQIDELYFRRYVVRVLNMTYL